MSFDSRLYGLRCATVCQFVAVHSLNVCLLTTELARATAAAPPLLLLLLRMLLGH